MSKIGMSDEARAMYRVKIAKLESRLRESMERQLELTREADLLATWLANAYVLCRDRDMLPAIGDGMSPPDPDQVREAASAAVNSLPAPETMRLRGERTVYGASAEEDESKTSGPGKNPVSRFFRALRAAGRRRRLRQGRYPMWVWSVDLRDQALDDLIVGDAEYSHDTVVALCREVKTLREERSTAYRAGYRPPQPIIRV